MCDFVVYGMFVFVIPDVTGVDLTRMDCGDLRVTTVKLSRAGVDSDGA